MKTFLTSLMSLLMTFASALAVNYNLTTFQPDETLTDDQLVEIDTISNGAELTLKIRINGVKVELANPKDSTYSIRLPKFGVATAKGSADVPKGLFYLPVPNGYNHANIKFVAIDSVSHKIKLAAGNTPGLTNEIDKLVASTGISCELARNGNQIAKGEFGLVINPVSYNVSTSMLSFASETMVTLEFDATSTYKKSNVLEINQSANEEFLKSDGITVLSAMSDEPFGDIIPNFPMYIIFSTSDKFDLAVSQLANWKRKLGYNVAVIDKSYFDTHTDIDSSNVMLLSRWVVCGLLEGANVNFVPNPEMIKVLLFGDFNSLSPYSYNFDDFIGAKLDTPSFYDIIYSDMYGATGYGSWEGEDHLLPDISIGRIPCSTMAQSLSAVNKIILHEKRIISPEFEQKMVISLCSEFLDENRDDCEDTRWIQTMAKWENRIDPYCGYDLPFLFAKETDVTPLYWNSSEFGGKLTYDIKNTDWSTDASDVSNAFDSSDYMFYMGRSDSKSGWKYPNFTFSDAQRLTNTDAFPIVFSLASSTGNMWNSYDLMQQLLFNPRGGMAGGIAPSDVIMPSYQHLLMDALCTSQWTRDLFECYYPLPENKYNNVFLGDWTRSIGKYLNIYYPDYMDSYNKQMAMLMHTIGDPALLLPDAPRLNVDVTISTTANGRCSIQVGNGEKDYGIIIYEPTCVLVAEYGNSLTTNIPKDKDLTVCINDFVSVPLLYQISGGMAVASPSSISLGVIGSSNLYSAKGFTCQGLASEENASIYVTNLQGTFSRQYECGGRDVVDVNFMEYPQGVFKAVLIGDNGKSEPITLTK